MTIDIGISIRSDIMQNSQLKIGDWIHWVSMYLLLLFSSGYYFRDNMGTRALAIMTASALALMATYGIKKEQGTKNLIILFSSVMIWALFCSFLAHDEIKKALIFFIGYSVALIIAISVKPFDYMQIFLKVTRLLIVFSLVINFFEIINIHIYQFIPHAVINKGHFLLLTTIRDYGSQVRNSSIFWEPGAYQTILVISYLFELITRSKHNVLYRWLIIVSIITTLSTTGIICALILIVCQIIEEEDQLIRNNHIKRLIIITIITMIIIFVGMQFFSDKVEYLLSRNITTKFHFFFSDSTQDASSSVRRDSIKYPLQKFISNPITGVGASGLNSISEIVGHTMLTCTWINWFAKSGLLYGLFMTIGLWKLTTLGLQTKSVRILMFITIIVSISSENYIDNPIVIVLSLYGFAMPHQIETKE